MQLFQGPLLVPTRVMGLGGAYTALAEGIQGTYANAAAPAVREPFSFKSFDYDVTAGLQLPGAFSTSDFENRGSEGTASNKPSAFSSFITVNLGFQVQWGPVGVSATDDLQLITLASPSSTSPGLVMTINRINALAAVAMFHGQLVVGGGVRAVGLNIAEDRAQATSQGLIAIAGIAPQVGALLRPNGLPWRIGATLRQAVTVSTSSTAARSATDEAGVAHVGSFILPANVQLPWELEAGFALQLGPRPLNPMWIDPTEHEAGARAELEANPTRDAKARFDEEHARLLAIRKARYANWPRERLLVSASVVMTGPGSDSVSIESFLEQRLDPFGRTTTVSPRVGLEGEPVVNWVRARAGSYLEPSRYENGASRQHFTFGTDIRLFYFSPFGLFDDAPWMLTLGLDLAPRYTNYGITIGPFR